MRSWRKCWHRTQATSAPATTASAAEAKRSSRRRAAPKSASKPSAGLCSAVCRASKSRARHTTAPTKAIFAKPRASSAAPFRPNNRLKPAKGLMRDKDGASALPRTRPPVRPIVAATAETATARRTGSAASSPARSTAKLCAPTAS